MRDGKRSWLTALALILIAVAMVGCKTVTLSRVPPLANTATFDAGGANDAIAIVGLGITGLPAEQDTWSAIWLPSARIVHYGVTWYRYDPERQSLDGRWDSPAKKFEFSKPPGFSVVRKENSDCTRFFVDVGDPECGYEDEIGYTAYRIEPGIYVLAEAAIARSISNVYAIARTRFLEASRQVNIDALSAPMFDVRPGEIIYLGDFVIDYGLPPQPSGMLTVSDSNVRPMRPAKVVQFSRNDAAAAAVLAGLSKVKGNLVFRLHNRNPTEAKSAFQ